MAESELDRDAEPGAEKGDADADFWVAASTGIFMRQWLDRRSDGDAAERPPSRRRRRMWLGLLGAAALVCLLPVVFFVVMRTRVGARLNERARLAAACESSETEHLPRMLACIELCRLRSAVHCLRKGDLYSAGGDASSAVRSYREACRLGESRGCIMASPAP